MIRPVLRPEERKIRITIRLDRDIVNYFRSTGRGWQTRLGPRACPYRQTPQGGTTNMIRTFVVVSLLVTGCQIRA
jgi:hypothetical protein